MAVVDATDRIALENGIDAMDRGSKLRAVCVFPWQHLGPFAYIPARLVDLVRLLTAL